MKLLSLAFVTVVFGSLIACNSPSSESVGGTDSDLISDIQSMQRRTDGRYDVICRDGSHETRSSDELAAQTVCRGGVNGVGILYGDSNCNSGYQSAVITPADNCASVNGTYNTAYSFKDGNGQCHNFSIGLATRQACDVAHGAKLTVLYGDSNCNSGYQSAIATTPDSCASLSGTYNSAYSYKDNDGQCHNFSIGLGTKQACSVAQGAKLGIIYGDSNCNSGYQSAVITSEDACASVNGTYNSAYSYKDADGQCHNFSIGLSTRQACGLAQGARLGIIYGDSNCNSGYQSAVITSQDECASVSGTYSSAYSYKDADGQCHNFSTGLTTKQACDVALAN